jgi:hypothetical protein
MLLRRFVQLAKVARLIIFVFHRKTALNKKNKPMMVNRHFKTNSNSCSRFSTLAKAYCGQP